VSGSIAERARVSSYGGFVVVMTGIIYPLLVSWTWGGGWLSKIGFYDFAGSGVVHLTGGVAGLVGAYVCGPRLGKFKSIRNEGDYD
jgi:ammonium transporter, Amt family